MTPFIEPWTPKVRTPCQTLTYVHYHHRGTTYAVDAKKAWFPEPPHARHITAAVKAICNTCPERRPCLEAALERGEAHGIWGGVDFTKNSRGRSEATRQFAPVTIRRAA